MTFGTSQNFADMINHFNLVPIGIQVSELRSYDGAKAERFPYRKRHKGYVAKCQSSTLSGWRVTELGHMPISNLCAQPAGYSGLIKSMPDDSACNKDVLSYSRLVA
jgi:hypothetical protein